MKFIFHHPSYRCLKVFVTTFLFACLFQIILFCLYKSLPSNLFSYYSKNKQHSVYSSHYFVRRTDQIVNYYLKEKYLAYDKFSKDNKLNLALNKIKAINNNETDLILEFEWNFENNSDFNLNLENQTNKFKLPYFFQKNPSFRPNVKDKKFSNLAIWPEQATHDRIINQLMYIPLNYDKKKLNRKKKLKKILLYAYKYTFNQREVPNGQSRFLIDNCPVNTCEITRDNSEAKNVDAILFKEKVIELKHKRSPNQIWIFYNLESPSNSPTYKIKNKINWTATYRQDSDLVTPYAKFVYYSKNIKRLPNEKDFLASKTKDVAWFVSNCGSNNRRQYYVRQLAKLIDVDIYGRCGTFKCSRNKAQSCFALLQQEYKYYISFENSNCRDYISEKFFLNSLNNNVVPIVLGPDLIDYLKIAPNNSFISIEEFHNVDELAKFLHFLNNNSTIYNQFFEWKNTGEFINTFFWCRLCALMHAPVHHKVYQDLDSWWKSSNICNDRKTLNYIKL